MSNKSIRTAEVTVSIIVRKNTYYKAAIKKYGKVFADAVLTNELQLFADTMDNCFEDYVKYPWMKHLMKGQGKQHECTRVKVGSRNIDGELRTKKDGKSDRQNVTS